MALDRLARKHSPTEAEALDAEGRGDEASIFSMAPMPDPDHRREHSRFHVDLDVTVGSDHNFYAGFAENLSSGGVFIATHKLKPTGSKVELSINLPDGITLQADGEVRWVRVFNELSDTPPGMGVKFTDLSSASLAIIQSFLARREPLFFDDE